MSRPYPVARRYSWTDYQGWPDDERWELIEGQAHSMAPAPTTRHQSIAGNVFAVLHARLKGKACKPFLSPIDVKLSDEDVVQPDVLVVCDPSKITPTHIEGAPDLVIEVLSPSTSAKDLREKKALYQRSGIREYLVIDPMENYAQRFVLGESGRYGEGDILAPEDQVTLIAIEGVEFPLWEILELPEPSQVVAKGPGES